VPKRRLATKHLKDIVKNFTSLLCLDVERFAKRSIRSVGRERMNRFEASVRSLARAELFSLLICLETALAADRSATNTFTAANNKRTQKATPTRRTTLAAC
jgi:hypothetical protein